MNIGQYTRAKDKARRNSFLRCQSFSQNALKGGLSVLSSILGNHGSTRSWHASLHSWQGYSKQISPIKTIWGLHGGGCAKTQDCLFLQTPAISQSIISPQPGRHSLILVGLFTSLESSWRCIIQAVDVAALFLCSRCSLY